MSESDIYFFTKKYRFGKANKFSLDTLIELDPQSASAFRFWPRNQAFTNSPHDGLEETVSRHALCLRFFAIVSVSFRFAAAKVFGLVSVPDLTVSRTNRIRYRCMFAK